MPLHLSAPFSARAHDIDETFSVRSLNLPAEHASPLMAVDDFRVSGRPFGPHPHAGFSAITYVFRDSPGRLRNRDSLGGHVVVAPGGLAWLQAGAGAMHEEIPADRAELRGLQVFVNLSAKNKLAMPKSLSVAPEQVPQVTTDGAKVFVVVGSFAGATSPLAPLEPFTLLDVALRRQLEVQLPRGNTAVVYVRRGQAVVHTGDTSQPLAPGEALSAFGGEGTLRVTTEQGAELVVLSGLELNEPVVAQGPFIMNDRAQLMAAFERYRAGSMGELEPYAEG